MAIASNFPAIKPSLSLDFANTKRLDSRVTFTRTTTATYYDGVTTAMAEQNLQLYSQEFDNAYWDKISASVSANAVVAPDGTSTAETITFTGAGSSARITSVNSVTTGATYTFSVFLKGTAGQTVSIEFDTTPGTTVTLTSTWARYTVTNTATASTVLCRIISRTGNTATVFDAWGAQLEQRSSVSSYTATTTQAITNYIPVLLTAASGVARFDHNPTTDESLGLLIEEARTNLLTYSADFSNAAWTKNASSITSNTIVAPDGTLTGDKAIANTSATEHFFEQTCSTNTNQSYTQTIYVKRGEESQFNMMVVSVGASTTTSLAKFSISAGGVVTADGGFAGLISSYSATNVGNGWYRCSIVYTLNGTVTSHRMRIYPGSNSASAVGNDFNGSYFWGAQLEAGAFPTSYIATTAATVTRNADAASMTGSNFTSWYNAAEGTFVLQGITNNAAATKQWLAVDDGTSVNRIRLATNTSRQAFVDANVGSVSQGITTTSNTFTLDSSFIEAAGIASNNVAISLNGGTVATDTSFILPTVTRLGIGSGETSPVQFCNGTIKKLAYYPLRVTNANLQALTS